MSLNSGVISTICLIVAIVLCVFAAIGVELGRLNGINMFFLAIAFYFASELEW